jgi:hypothetical protein
LRAELQSGREHEAAPGRAERDERRKKNAETGFHDFTSDVSSGELTIAIPVLSNPKCHLKVAAKMFAAKRKLPINNKSQPIVLMRKN